jgi:hypothetical protein
MPKYTLWSSGGELDLFKAGHKHIKYVPKKTACVDFVFPKVVSHGLQTHISWHWQPRSTQTAFQSNAKNSRHSHATAKAGSCPLPAKRKCRKLLEDSLLLRVQTECVETKRKSFVVSMKIQQQCLLHVKGERVEAGEPEPLCSTRPSRSG